MTKSINTNCEDFERRSSSADGATLYLTSSDHQIASCTTKARVYIHNQKKETETKTETEGNR